MTRLLIVALGGAAGSAARYLASGYVQRWTTPFFPTGTLAVNLIGCFVVGFLAEAAAARAWPLSQNARLFLIVGFCGGFTTFSAFGWETLELVRGDALWRGVLNASVQVVGGLVAVAGGMMLARSL
jgi:CrcB protein